MPLLPYTVTNGRGSPVVLVHGWGLHSGVWANLAAALAAEYKCTRLDLPGHGRSGRLRGELGTLEALLSRLRGVIRVPGTWVGWSLGGLVALAYAWHFPEQVQRLVLVASTVRFTQTEGWSHGLDKAVVDGFSADLERSETETLNHFLALQMLGDENARAGVRKLRVLLRECQPERQALQDGLQMLRDVDLRGILPRLKCPVRIILGARDRLIPVSVGNALTRMAQNGRLAVIPGAAHAPLVSHPAKFILQLRRFLHD